MLPKNLIKLLLLLLFICVVNYATAQPIIPRFEQLSVNDGLSHSSVYSILQDKKGFMWFGTPDGLCRYDGSSLTSYKYKPQSANDIVNNFVRGKIFEDKVGNIWYGNESGIYKWDLNVEKVVKVKEFKKNEFGNAEFRAVSMDDNGALWLLNIADGIFKFDILTAKLIQFPFPASRDNASVILTYHTVDVAGNIWIRIVSKNDPYLVFNKASHVFTSKYLTNPPHALFFSKQKEVQAYEDRLVYKDLSTGISSTVLKNVDKKKLSFIRLMG